jgi:hypothetical protein
MVIYSVVSREKNFKRTNDFQMNARLHGQRKGKECERIKLDAGVTTLDTTDARFELSMEEIDDD